MLNRESHLATFQTLVRGMYVVAQTIQDKLYREKLQYHILALVELFFKREEARFKEDMMLIDLFFHTATDLYFITEENYFILHREIKCFDTIFSEYHRKEQPTLGISEIRNLFPESRKDQGGGDNDPDKVVPIPRNNDFKYTDFELSTTSGGLGRRQEAILKIFEEKGSVRLMDILGRFPEFNEKTIRNDLKVLCGRGNIMRVGNGGRGNRYQHVMSLLRPTSGVPTN